MSPENKKRILDGIIPTAIGLVVAVGVTLVLNRPNYVTDVYLGEGNLVVEFLRGQANVYSMK